MVNPWLIIGAMGIAAAAGLQGYRMGQSDCEAAHNASQLEMMAEGEKLKRERIEAEQRRDELARQLEIEANEDPIVVTRCLGPSRVRRLQSLH